MSQIVDVKGKSVKDLQTPLQLPTVLSILNNVKIVAGNFPLGFQAEAFLLSQIINILKKHIDTPVSNIADYTYKTLAEANAASSKFKEGDMVLITNDGNNNWLWRFNGTALEKTEYQTLVITEAYNDIQTIKEVVEGDYNTDVTSQYGDVFYSLAKALRIIINNGLLGATPYRTKALLDAALATTEEDAYAIVTDDKTNGVATDYNGYWQKQSGAWVYLAWNPFFQFIKKIGHWGEFYTLADLQQITVAKTGSIGVVTSDQDESKNGTYAFDGTTFVKSAYDPLMQAKASILNNVLFDPFNETVSASKQDDQSFRNAVFTNLLTTSSNSEFKKPTLEGVGSAEVRRFFDIAKTGLKASNSIFVKVKVFFTSTTNAKVTFYLRKADNTVIQSNVKTATVSGVVDLVSTELLITSDTDHILVLVQSDDTKELIATAISTLNDPKFVYGASPASLDKSTRITVAQNTQNITTIDNSVKSLTQNLMPDAFFRAYSAGVLSIDGYPLFNEATSVWEVVSDSNNPFKTDLALVATDGLMKNRRVNFKWFGLKVGDVVTFRALVKSSTAGQFRFAAYVRNGANAVIGSTSYSAFSLEQDIAQEVAHTLTITQEQLDGGAYFEVRFNAANIALTEYRVYAMSAVKNNMGASISDTNYFDDQVLIALNQETNTADVPFIEGDYYLRNSHDKLCKRKFDESAKLVVSSIGDSWTQGAARWVRPLASYMQAQFGDGGGGWLGFGFTGSLTNGNAKSSIYYSRTGTWTSVYGTGASPSPDACHVVSSEVGAKLTATVTNSANVQRSGVDLFYIGSSDGVIKYRINANDWTTLNLNDVAVGSLGVIELTGINSSGNTVIEIEVISGTCNIAGLNFKSDSDGAVWHKLGASGSQAYGWSQVNANEWKKGIQSLDPDLVTIMFGTNDQNQSRSVETFKNSISTIIDNVRLAKPLVDIAVIMPCENLRVSNPIAMKDYTSAVYDLCKTKKVCFMDLQKAFGENPQDYADRFNADLIHPRDTDRVIADALIRLLLG